MKPFFTTALGLALVSSSLVAATIATISYPAIDPAFTQYKQTTQSPCVIGDNSCNNPSGFLYTLLPTIPGNVVNPAYDEVSPTYTAGQIVGIIGNVFGLGLDLNNTVDPQTIKEVSMYVAGSLHTTWTGTLSIKAANNGTGFSDVNFFGFNLSNVNAATAVYFALKMNAVNDGKENLFLINGRTPVQEQIPEPATFALIGGALIALKFLRARK